MKTARPKLNYPVDASAGDRSSRGGPRGPPSRDVTISKALSWMLRHGALKSGLPLDSEGYANVAELLRSFPSHLPTLIPSY